MHEKDKELYQLVFIEPEDLSLFPTKTEKAEALLKSEKQRADAEKQRADAEKQRADAEKQKSEQYLELLKKNGIKFE
jgi:hypothetical protein